MWNNIKQSIAQRNPNTLLRYKLLTLIFIFILKRNLLQFANCQMTLLIFIVFSFILKEEKKVVQNRKVVVDDDDSATSLILSRMRVSV